jgi:hypothetical protein
VNKLLRLYQLIKKILQKLIYRSIDLDSSLINQDNKLNISIRYPVKKDQFCKVLKAETVTKKAIKVSHKGNIVWIPKKVIIVYDVKTKSGKTVYYITLPEWFIKTQNVI